MTEISSYREEHRLLVSQYRGLKKIFVAENLKKEAGYFMRNFMVDKTSLVMLEEQNVGDHNELRMYDRR